MLYKGSTRFAKFKTDAPKLYKSALSFQEVKTDSPTMNKDATRFAKVKTDSRKFYKALRKWKRPSKVLQGCDTPCGSKNPLSEALLKKRLHALR